MHASLQNRPLRIRRVIRRLLLRNQVDPVEDMPQRIDYVMPVQPLEFVGDVLDGVLEFADCVPELREEAARRERLVWCRG
jgi:hypothetical protein